MSLFIPTKSIRTPANSEFLSMGDHLEVFKELLVNNAFDNSTTPYTYLYKHIEIQCKAWQVLQ